MLVLPTGVESTPTTFTPAFPFVAQTNDFDDVFACAAMLSGKKIEEVTRNAERRKRHGSEALLHAPVWPTDVHWSLLPCVSTNGEPSMNIDETKFTTYSAICAVVLREVRVQRGMHRAQIADYFAKPSSAWENIETGKARIDFDILVRVCRGLFLPPSMVLNVVDGYDMFLRAQGWSVVVSDNGSNAPEGLTKLAHEFWATPGGRYQDSQPIMAVAPILNAPYQQNKLWYGLANVFLYAVDEPFRANQQNFQIPPAPPIVQPYQSIFDLAFPVPPVTTAQAPTAETTDADV